MSVSGKEYIFNNARIASITFADLLSVSSNMDDLNKSNIADILPRFLEINSGVFFKENSTFAFPDVAINQVGNSVILLCSCTTIGTKICQHQAQVLFAILERPEYRIFYDDVFRHNKLITVAKEYGLENEVLLDDYFHIIYENKSIHIQPKIKELFKVDVEAIKQKLLSKNDTKNINFPDIETVKKSFLVLRNHKYYEQLIVEIYECELNKSGKLKNPLIPIDPIEQVWKCNSIEEAKFFTAVSKFKHNYAVEEEKSNIEVLKILVENVMQYDTYFHDKSISDNVNAHSLIPIYLTNTNAKIELAVFKKEPFYEITGGLNDEGTFYPFKELQISFNYFIQQGQFLSLVANADMLRVINFFKSNHEILLIHASKFDDFKNVVLSNLERQVSINYAYIQPATKEQLLEKNFDNTVERIIYLSDQEQYIGITPVMKYGNIEIPVF